MEPTYLGPDDDDLSTGERPSFVDPTAHPLPQNEVLTVPLPYAALTEMAKEIHAQAIKSGWWPPIPADRNVGEILMLITDEASEAHEEYRAGSLLSRMMYENPCSGEVTSQQTQCPEHGLGKPVGIPSEMADIIIRTLDACEAWGIDIAAAVAEKVAYNKTRPYRHGDKRA